MGFLANIANKVGTWLGITEPVKQSETIPTQLLRANSQQRQEIKTNPNPPTSPIATEKLLEWAKANPYRAKQLIIEAKERLRTKEQSSFTNNQPIEFDKDKFASITFSEPGSIPKVIELKLKNGIKVILAPDNTANQFNMKTSYALGSKDDHIPGTAHFLEHLLGGRTPTQTFQAGENWDIVEFNGGHVNAATEQDTTWYDISLPTEFIELAFKIESERMQSSDLNTIKDVLPIEKSVIEAEIKRYEDDTHHVVDEELRRLFYANSKYQEPVLGSVDSVKSIRVEDLQELYNKYKDPENLTITIAGNIGDPARLEHLLLNYFGSIKKPAADTAINAYNNPKIQAANKDTSKEKIITKAGDAKALALAYETPGVSSKDYVVIETLAHALTTGSNSIFHKKLIEDKGIKLQSIYVSPMLTRDRNALELYFETDKFTDLDALRQEVRARLKDIADNGIDENLLHHIKLLYLASQLHSMEDQESKASVLTIYNQKGSWQDYTNSVPKIQQITNDDIKRVVKKYLVEGEEHTVFLKPSGKDKTAINDKTTEDFKTTSRVADPSRLKKLTDAICGPQTIHPPQISLSTLQDGNCKILVNENHKTPTAAIRISTFKKPDSLKEKLVAQVLLMMIGQVGTEKYNRDQINNLFKEIGALMTFSLDQEEAQIILGTTTIGENIKKFADLFKELLLHPRLDVENFSAAKGALKNIIKEENNDPNTAAVRELKNGIYTNPSDTLYHGSREERWQLADSISYEDLLKYWGKLKAGQFTIAASGDINQEQIKTYFSSVVNQWTASANSNLQLDIAQPHKDDIQELEGYEFKGEQEQVHFISGSHCKINELHKDYYPLLLANHILGGNSISSRLGRFVRANKGLVYGLSSALQLGIKQEGLFLIGASAKKANTDKLRQAIQAATAKFPDDITEEEVHIAKQNIINSFYMNSFKDNASRAAMMKWLEQTGRDMSFVENYGALINSISREQIINAVREHLDLQKLVEVVADDKLKVNGQEINTKFDAKEYKARLSAA